MNVKCQTFVGGYLKLQNLYIYTSFSRDYVILNEIDSSKKVQYIPNNFKKLSYISACQKMRIMDPFQDCINASWQSLEISKSEIAVAGIMKYNYCSSVPELRYEFQYDFVRTSQLEKRSWLDVPVAVKRKKKEKKNKSASTKVRHLFAYQLSIYCALRTYCFKFDFYVDLFFSNIFTFVLSHILHFNFILFQIIK